MIEGYYDPLIMQLANLPIYLGGDTTNSPYLSIDQSPTNSANNMIAFLSGTGDNKQDYLLTRQYAKWMNQENISILRKDYKTIN